MPLTSKTNTMQKRTNTFKKIKLNKQKTSQKKKESILSKTVINIKKKKTIMQS